MRLFIAINLPASVRATIWEATEGLRASGYPVRWVRQEGIHLTLKFLGEVPDDKLAALNECLTDAVGGARRFVLPIGEFGAFPPTGTPRVVWVGCEAVPALELLQHNLECSLEGVGFPKEGRPFRPHLTVGRVKRGARGPALSEIRVTLDGLELAAQPLVSSVDLMESKLGRAGARYECRLAVELAE